jgi:hypothetical protein
VITTIFFEQKELPGAAVIEICERRHNSRTSDFCILTLHSFGIGQVACKLYSCKESQLLISKGTNGSLSVLRCPALFLDEITFRF